jgi:hypothetical protein
VTVEVHPVVAQHEHQVRNGAEDGAVPLFALAQRFLRPVMLDRRSSELRGGLDQTELLAAGTARHAAVHRERAEHLLLRRQDRCRPAGPNADRYRRVAHDVPSRVSEDVRDDDGPADLHHGSARPDARADRLAVEACGVFLGKARRRAHSHMSAVRIEQQRRTRHPLALLLDDVYEASQHLSKRCTGRDHLEHLMLAALERLGAPQRGRVA